MNLVEMIADPEEQSQSPCKYGNIVSGHACYCHHTSEDAPRKCPIWREGGAGDVSKWKRVDWLPEDYQTVSVRFETVNGKSRRIITSELGKTWPDEGCPMFEPNL